MIGRAGLHLDRDYPQLGLFTSQRDALIGLGISHLAGPLSPDFVLGEGSPSDGRVTPVVVAGVQA